MIRICMDCKKHLGEKCPLCGSTDVNLIDYTMEPDHFNCNGCGHAFTEGEGGFSHGCCAKCVEIREAERRAYGPPFVRRHEP